MCVVLECHHRTVAAVVLQQMQIEFVGVTVLLLLLLAHQTDVIVGLDLICLVR